MNTVKWTEIFVLGLAMALGLSWFNFAGPSQQISLQDRSVGRHH